MALVLVALRAPSSSDTDSGGTIKVAAPPNSAKLATPCATLVAALPVQLDKLDQRVVQVTPEIASVIAWGTPAIVLRCGVDRPEDFQADSRLQNGGSLDGPWFDITYENGASVWTAVDRAPYISISVPTRYTPAGPIAALSTLIRKTLPAVCAVSATAPPDTLCTRRP